MTPSELARELGVSIQRVNGVLHELFPRGADARYARWELSQEQAQSVRACFASHGRSSVVNLAAPSSVRDAWYWEGNVQSRIAAYLAREGWQLVRVADTGARERGDDILARRGGRELVVEVKGYPSADYADPARAGEIKAAPPTLQAHHWLADAVLKSLRTLGRRPEVRVAIGLPRLPRYERLLAEVCPALQRLDVGILLVDEAGAVTEFAI